MGELNIKNLNREKTYNFKEMLLVKTLLFVHVVYNLQEIVALISGQYNDMPKLYNNLY